MILNEKSLEKLSYVHPDLQRVILAAAIEPPQLFIVTEGLRTLERQRELFLAKKSKTMNSRHITGHAVDLACWMDFDSDRVVDVDELSWKFHDYKNLADHIKRIANEFNIPIVWGGDWTTLKDGPHFELSRKYYP